MPLAAITLPSSTVYSNSFDAGAASLAGFTIGNGAGNVGPYSVSVVAGQLQIDTFLPTPTAGYAAINTSVFGSPYSSILRNNPGTVTWAFNVSNQDGAFNNGFFFSLASSSPDSQVFTSTGYALGGGGYVGNRMIFYRNGTGATVIDIPAANGLGPLPNKGSFRITYEPATDLWSSFGFVGTSYVDPTTVTALLGSAVDGTFTGVALPYLCLGGGSTGSDFYDNLTVSVVPEPSMWALLTAGALTALVLPRWQIHQTNVSRSLTVTSNPYASISLAEQRGNPRGR